MSKDTARIRDQLGRNPDTFPTLNADYDEELIVEEGPLIASTNTLGNAWIVGSSTNGIVGTNTSTQAGGQQVVGGSGRVENVVRVINYQNKYIDNLDTTTFNDAGSTTATWSGDGEITFTNTEIAQSLSVFLNTQTVIAATLIVDDATNLSLQLSADGGSNWETVTNNTRHEFTNTGNDLRFKFTASGVATVSRVTIQYET